MMIGRALTAGDELAAAADCGLSAPLAADACGPSAPPPPPPSPPPPSGTAGETAASPPDEDDDGATA